MDSSFPHDAPPRSKPSLAEAIKEKVRGADVVAVGVNIVVAALLIGGVVGALTVNDAGAQAPEVNAALVSAEESDANATAPSPEPGEMPASSEQHDDEDASDK